jgi:hypothetical protein
VGDDGDVAKVHSSSSGSDNDGESDLTGKPGSEFPDRTQNLELRAHSALKLLALKKEARPKGPGTPLLIAAQYSQKSPKNNALFRV